MHKTLKITSEFFDIFGTIAFIYITTVGIWTLKYTEKLPDWTAYLLILIGVFGIIIDGTIVYKTYLRIK